MSIFDANSLIDKAKMFGSSNTVKIEDLKEEYSGWFSPFKTTHLRVIGMSTGCGLMQIDGLHNVRYDFEEVKKELEAIKEKMSAGVLPSAASNHPRLTKPVRALVGALGSSFKEAFPKVEQLGFKQLATYDNYTMPLHGTSVYYTQTLFLLTW